MAPQPAFRLSFPLALLLLATSHSAHQVEGNEQKHFVLVHGLGHGAWCWYKIIALLEEARQRVTAVDLNSNGINKVVADSITSIEEYAQPLTQLMATIDDKVIIVGHSLGGGVISYAMEKFPQKIEKAVFLAAFMPANNQSVLPGLLLQMLGEILSQGILVQNFGNGASSPATSVYINTKLARDYFYNESPHEDVVLATTLLNPTPTAALFVALELTSAGYGSIPRFYLRTPLDHTIVPAVQAAILEQNPPHEVITIDKSDHSTFFSRPVDLTKILLSIANLQIETKSFHNGNSCPNYLSTEESVFASHA